MQVQAAVDGKPEYHTLTAIVAMIDPQQAFYYQANPATNRKVSCWPRVRDMASLGKVTCRLGVS